MGALAFEEHGPVDGPVICLIHAFPVNRGMWVPVAERLADSGWRVILPDLPGFGESPLAQAEPAMAVMADEVLGLMDSLQVDQFVVGGLSMGGYVVMELMRRAPQRLRGVILADTKGAADPEAARANRLRVAEAVLEAGHTRALAATMLPNLLGATSRALAGEALQNTLDLIHATAPEAVAWAQRAMADRPESLGTLGESGAPALIVWGEEDVISPRDDQDAMLAALGDRGRLAEIPRAGHLSAIENPVGVAEAVQGFLSQLG